MDSGNSDSSSCGEDQEYDSRAAAAYSFSSFVNHPIPPSPPPLDPFSNFLQLQNSSPLNQNVFWPRNTELRSDPCPNTSVINFPFTPPPKQPTAVVSGNNLTYAPPSSAAENATQNRNLAARNTKKRSRASRRAPTTVLTTDTSNFRAMVQEFTGIPAPPFTSSSSPFQRSRLDLYSASSSMRLKSHDPAQPSYLHRTFSSEIQPPPPPQPFLSSNASISSSTTNGAASTSTPINYQSLPTQNSNLFNLISNPNLTSLFLQTDHKFPFSSSILSSKIQGSFEVPSHELHSNIKTVGFDEFPLRHGNDSANIGNLPNLISSDQVQPRNDHNNDNNIINHNNNPNEIVHDRAETRTLNASHSFSRNPGSGKMNYLANPSTDFHGEKGQENIATRSSEGIVESWICSSELK